MARNDVAVALTTPREEPVQFSPEPDWRTKKELIRRRTRRLTEESNRLYGRNDSVPSTKTEAIPGKHGSYLPLHDIMTWELGSVQDKWPRFYEGTMPHEFAHRAEREVGGLPIRKASDHGEEFQQFEQELARALLAPDTERARELREAQLKAKREWMANNPEARKLLEGK